MSADDPNAPIFPPGSVRRFGIALTSGVIYGVALGFLGVSPFKALVIGCIATAAGLFHFGTRWIQRIAIGLGGYALGVWIDLLPPLERWRALIFSFFPPA